MAAFSSLTDRLSNAFKHLKSKGKLSEADIDGTIREIRRALLDADVALDVVRSFTGRIRERALGTEVSEALNPAQQVVKIVNEELTAVLGAGVDRPLNFAKNPPTIIMLAGLQGAGKTTLAEAMLFNAGRIRKRGRVDDGDSHLDTNEIERERGITIFSSQAVLDHGDTHVMLVDAPGHVDFSAEAERTLRALDYAILVVGANDGVQGHTETLWRLLARYDIPTFIFINKIDLENPGRDVLLAQLGQRLSEGCLDANELLAGGTVQEDAAALDEAALEEFLEMGELSVATLSRMVAERKLFPCFAGSALKDQGVDELLDDICALMREQAWLPEFAARVYRVSRGDRGERLAWVKVTGGTLHAKQVLRHGSKRSIRYASITARNTSLPRKLPLAASAP